MTEGDRTLDEVLDAVAKHFEISREELVRILKLLPEESFARLKEYLSHR